MHYQSPNWYFLPLACYILVDSIYYLEKQVCERKRLLEKFTELVEHTESKEENKHDWDGAKSQWKTATS